MNTLLDILTVCNKVPNVGKYISHQHIQQMMAFLKNYLSFFQKIPENSILNLIFQSVNNTIYFPPKPFKMSSIIIKLTGMQ